MTRARWIALTALIVAVVFAWRGGTFTEGSFRALRAERADALARIVTMTREIDSLKAVKDSLTNNPETQIHYAREKFGMTWPGEKTFLVTFDSADVVPVAGGVKKP